MIFSNILYKQEKNRIRIGHGLEPPTMQLPPLLNFNMSKTWNEILTAKN